MTLFRFTAITRSGAHLSGEADVETRAALIEDLNRRGHLPVEILEIAATRDPRQARARRLFEAGPSSQEITLFTHELSALLKAGLPLTRALSFLAKDAPSKRLKDVIERVAGSINSGKSLNEALALEGDTFPPIYVSMVRAAEASGTLDVVLGRLAEGREKVEKLRSKALSQALYPMFLIFMAIAAVTIMLVLVVPRFKSILSHGSAHIPEDARFVIGVSDWLIANGAYLALAIAALSLSAALALRRGAARETVERLLYRLPLLGTLLRLNLAVRFSAALGLLLENGVELPAAIRLVRDVIGNAAASRVIDQSYDALRKGHSFLDPISQSGLFPPMLVNILRVGEETGNLAASLSHMSSIIEGKLEIAVDRTFTIVEPVIILLVSAMIAGIVISIMTAIISINDLAV